MGVGLKGRKVGSTSKFRCQSSFSFQKTQPQKVALTFIPYTFFPVFSPVNAFSHVLPQINIHGDNRRRHRQNRYPTQHSRSIRHIYGYMVK